MGSLSFLGRLIFPGSTQRPIFYLNIVFAFFVDFTEGFAAEAEKHGAHTALKYCNAVCVGPILRPAPGNHKVFEQTDTDGEPASDSTQDNSRLVD